MKIILFIQGIPDNGLVRYISNGAIDTFGSSNIYNNIKFNGNIKKELLIMDSYKNTNIVLNNKIALLINQISEPDTHEISLKKTIGFYKHFKIKTINKPNYIFNTYRDRVYNSLKNINKIIIPKTIAIYSKTPKNIDLLIKENRISYPFLLRESGMHGGKKTIMIKKRSDLNKLFNIALDGRKYYITEYKDFKNEENLYIKYRLVVIGNDLFIRHAIVSDNWLIHSNNRIDKYINIEKDILKNFENNIKPYILSPILEISKNIKLDYFGIDCNIDSNFNVQIFEVNSNMNILIKSNNFTDIYTEKIRNSLEKYILEKIKDV